MPDDGERPSRTLAVLIDADNAKPSLLDAILKEAAKYGRPTVRRAYGDWTGPKLQQWKARLHEHAVQPMQQFTYVTGKNATDAALIIDAMDLLHGGLVDAFCIVSSDSDYTRLATRLREDGKLVIGMGRENTPAPLVRACDRFIHVENLDEEDETEDAAARASGRPRLRRRGRRGERGGREAPGRKSPKDALDILVPAFEAAQREDGWASLSGIGNVIQSTHPDFDPRTYGKRQLLVLLEALPEDFEIDRPSKGASGPVFVRLRDED